MVKDVRNNRTGRSNRGTPYRGGGRVKGGRLKMNKEQLLWFLRDPVAWWEGIHREVALGLLAPKERED